MSKVVGKVEVPDAVFAAMQQLSNWLGNVHNGEKVGDVAVQITVGRGGHYAIETESFPEIETPNESPEPKPAEGNGEKPSAGEGGDQVKTEGSEGNEAAEAALALLKEAEAKVDECQKAFDEAIANGGDGKAEKKALKKAGEELNKAADEFRKAGGQL